VGRSTFPTSSTPTKDKTFFFYSEEFRLEKTPTEYNEAVPGLKERGLLLTSQGLQPNLQMDPATGVYFQDFDFTDVCPANTTDFVRSQYQTARRCLSQGGGGS